MKVITGTSHLDHNLTSEQVQHIKELFAGRNGFFIETLELPPNLGTVPCGLHGPLMGDEQVPADQCWQEKRGNREYFSQVCKREPRQVRQVTVIAGPHEGDACILYTAFGGPLTPKEPNDPTLAHDKIEESVKFWRHHALTGTAEGLQAAIDRAKDTMSLGGTFNLAGGFIVERLKKIQG